MMPLPRLSVLCLCLLPLFACGDDAGSEPAPEPTGRALVSDWLNRRVDLIDLAAMKEGAERSDVLLDSLDLSDYEQVPLNAEVTPDGKTALVSLSAGFFAIPFAGTAVGATGIPQGPGRVLVVDLDTFQVTGEIETGNGPMGIAITSDSKEAIVAHFGSEALVRVDIAGEMVIDEVEIGVYGEEIALDDTGSVGIVGYSAVGDVVTFAADDLAVRSDEIMRPGDTAGVAFFPGTKTALVVQAATPLNTMAGYDLVDVSDPAAPEFLSGERKTDAPTTYPAAPVPARGSVIIPTALDGVLGLEEWKLTDSGDAAELVQSLDVGEAGDLFGAYGAVVDHAGRALLSAPVTREIVVVDLETGDHFAVAWGGAEAGPMDVAIVPSAGD